MLKLTALHYEKNWFTAIFSVMKKVVTDSKSGQPLFSFKQTWGNKLQVFSDPNFGNLLLEGRFVRGSVLTWSWDIYKADEKEPFTRMESNIAQTAMAFGAEVLTFKKPDGGIFLNLEREDGAELKHVADNMTELYNPTHVYTLKTPSGKRIGTIRAKHGIWKSFYDFVPEGGDEKEKEAALMAFAFILLMLKK